MFNALGRFVYRHRRVVVTLWLVPAVAGGAFAPRLSGELKAGGYSLPNAESERVARALARDFGFNATAPLLVFESDQLTVDDPAYRRPVEQAVTAISALEFVDGVDSYLDGVLSTVRASLDGHRLPAPLRTAHLHARQLVAN